MVVDLESMRVDYKMEGRKDLQDLVLKTLDIGNKNRNEDSRRVSGGQFDIRNHKPCENENSNIKQYGLVWGQNIKAKKFAKPSLKEVFDGLNKLLNQKIDKNLSGRPEAELTQYKEMYSEVFTILLNKAKGASKDKQEPADQYTNPDSIAVRLILWLFTIEPSFYTELNEACHQMDLKKLEELGPFARAVHLVLNYAGKNRLNKVPCGIDDEYGEFDPHGSFSRSFLLFRGCSLKKEWVNEWRDQVSRESVSMQGEPIAKQLTLQGNTITFESFRVALNFARCKDNTGLHTHIPYDFTNKETANECSVMFMISVQNYYGFNGFRLNGEKYSAYPLEKEVILLDGTQVAVMKVEDVKVNSNDEDFKRLNGKTLTFIHLFAVR